MVTYSPALHSRQAHESGIPSGITVEEHNKTEDEKLQDWAYLITHTLTCFITDAPSIWAMGWAQKHLPIPGAEPEASEPDSGDGNLLQKGWNDMFGATRLKEWAFGEGIGDLVAIPATVGVQRFAPGFMKSLEKPLESVFGGAYQQSAQKAADEWAEENDVAKGSQAHADYKQAHYNKEIHHLPQAAVWTAISMAAGIAAQKHLLPYLTNGELGQEEGYLELAGYSLIGKTITGIAANGPRMLWPETTNKLEHGITEATEHHITHPMTRLLGGNVERDRLEEARELEMAHA